MKFSAAVAALLPAIAAALPLDTTSALTPDPTLVHINGVTYGGTGCPQGTVGIAISADKTTMTLIFDSYVASLGPTVAVTENRKNCQLNIDLLYPSGFQYSIFSADYRGYAALDSGVTGTIKSTYYFSGSTSQVSICLRIRQDSQPLNSAIDLLLRQLPGPTQWRLPQARRGPIHLGRLVSLRSRRHAQRQLSSPPYHHQLQVFWSPYHRLHRRQVHSGCLRRVAIMQVSTTPFLHL
jgi:hypothetical protein